MAARYSSMDLDYLPGAPALSGGVAGGVQNVWSTGLNWYPNATVRFIRERFGADGLRKIVDGLSQQERSSVHHDRLGCHQRRDPPRGSRPAVWL